jgi:DNA-binding LacI/PurR family transcriptional regulator
MQLMSFKTTTLAPSILVPSTKNPENSVADLLRDQILSGEYKAGDWLPAERKLAEGLQVDRRTIRLAINRLIKSGLIIRQPHCRPIVAAVKKTPAPETVPAQAPSPASSFIALLMWRGGNLERTLAAQQRIFWGLDQALAEAGYHGVFVDVGALSTEAEIAVREAERLRYILQQGFGGAVFYPYAFRSNQALIEAVRREIPLVTIDRRSAAADTDFVGIQNRQAMYDTVRHLIEQGHRRIAYVTKNELVPSVQDRIQGYLDAIHEANLDEILLSIPSRILAQAWTVVDTIFRLPPGERPTAAAVFNDYSAVDLALRLETLGLSVPGDVAITGFDDIVPLLPNGVGLTTSAQPYEEIGRKAAELVLRRLKDVTAPAMTTTLPAPLIVRESSRYCGQDSPEP